MKPLTFGRNGDRFPSDLASNMPGKV